MDYEDILKFWFVELTPAQWWKKDEQLDLIIKQRFAEIYSKASLGELYQWRETARGRLAEIIILDQFSRNMFRNTAQAFATDAMALTLSQEAVKNGDDQVLEAVEKSFLYMPFMHSESAVIHEVAQRLFNDLGLQGNMDSEKQHFDIIKKFGRYPHRNQILWRESTEQEMDFLEQPGSSF
jgi:uncharacterized protein (DUF924 family)